MKKIICLNFLLFLFLNIFSFKAFANEIDLNDLFRDDASVYSNENNEKNKESNKDKEENNNIIEKNKNNISNEKQEIENTHGIKEEIVLDLEQEIIYEDKNITKDNTFLIYTISGLLIIFTIIIGVFITIKNSKR